MQTGFGGQPYGLLISAFDTLRNDRSGEPYRRLHVESDLMRTFDAGTTWKEITVHFRQSFVGFAPLQNNGTGFYEVPFIGRGWGAAASLDYVAMHRNVLSDRIIFSQRERGWSLTGDYQYVLHQPDTVHAHVLQQRIAVHVPALPLSLSASAALCHGFRLSTSDIHPSDTLQDRFSYPLRRLVPSFPEYRTSSFADTTASAVLGGSARLHLLSYEIQSDVPVLPVYIQRIISEAGYRSCLFSVSRKDSVYLDTLFARAVLEGSLVVGSLSSVRISLEGEYAFPVRHQGAYFSWNVFTSISL